MTDRWWQNGVVYQIYPRSFMDSNGDGIGDLAGIIHKLDYLVDLGIDTIWISPIYPSPMADFGYDVADYQDIHPMFGDMETFDRLLDAAHTRNLRVILDFVPNHSSDQHPWFLESRSSRDNPKRDWYIWRDPKADGSPPNNWTAFFGGQAWEWDEKTGQYYLHLFLKEQPDLNWRNPAVVAAIHDAMRFWLDKGVDGFRLDVITFVMKHPDMPDNPRIDTTENMFGQDTGGVPELAHVYDINQPEVHDVLRDIRRLVDAYEDRVTIGETWFLDPSELVQYYGVNLDELHIPFNFMVMKKAWDARAMRETIAAYYAAMPESATPNFVLGSHDEPRLASRFGIENVRSAGMLLLTLRGVPTLYYGDEIGMRDVDIPPEQYQDPQGINLGRSRDPERTPMQWDSSANAGFSVVRPWLPLAEDYEHVNVDVQMQDSQSTLHFYRRLLRLRRDLPALHRGDFAFVDSVPGDVLAYTRSAEGERLLIVINFGEQAYTLNVLAGTAELLLSTLFREAGTVDGSALEIAPHESLLLRLK